MDHRYRILRVAFAAAMLMALATAASAQVPVQIINSSPDPANTFVDIYIDGTKVAEDLAFKAATPFVDGGGVPQIFVTPTSTIVVADQTSVDDSSPLASVTLPGVLTPTLLEVLGFRVPGNFNPNPDGRSTAMQIAFFDGYKAAADDPQTSELMAVHAAPEVGTIDLIARAVHDMPGVGLPIFTNLAYGDFQTYIPLSPIVATLDIVETGTSNVIQTYVATLSLIQGAAAVGHAAGLPVAPDNDDLSLFGAVASGFVFELGKASRTDTNLPGRNYSLGENYPNPFNPNTVIPFTLDSAQHVKLTVFDMRGRAVETLIDGRREAGAYTVPFQATGLASGTYMYELRTADGNSSRTMTLVK